MKITVENLGVIREGSMEIPNKGGGMTILAGGNNSGKSYMSYLIYGYFKTITKENNSIHPLYLGQLLQDILTKDRLKKFLTLEGISININQFLVQSREAQEIIISSVLKLKSYNIFSNELNYNVKIKSPLRTYLLNDGNDVSLKTNNNDFFYGKALQNGFFELNSEKHSEKNNQTLVSIVQQLLLGLFSSFNQVIFFPAERSAINLFSKEIFREKALERDELARKIQMGEDLEKLLGEFKNNGTFTPRYPLAVSDYIYFVNDLRYAVEQPETEFADIADDIQAILQGTVGLSSFGDLQFTPSTEAKRLPLHLASSLVKSLSGLIIYFRHLAKEGDVIMIDEPELNLHPENQIRLARVLAKIANRGFNLIFSTHSDYILKELSSLTILSNEFEEKESLLEKYGYDKASILPKDKIKVYAFQNQTIEEIPVTEEGFDVTKIDTVIADMAQRSDDIYFSLPKVFNLMSKINETLRTVIADEVHLEYDYDTRQILIEEIENSDRKQLQAVCFELAKSCTFHFAFKLDDSNFQFLGQLFKSDVKNIRKAVDAVIICESGRKKYIFLVELKSKTSDGLVGKFKSTRLFINYLSNYLEAYHQLDLDDFEIKSILFDRKINKGKPTLRTRNNQSFFHQGFGHHRNNIARIQHFY